MRKFLLVLALLIPCAALAQTPTLTTEILVTTGTAVSFPRDSKAFSVEIYNHGPNAIWCALVSQSAAISGKSRKIAAEGTWAMPVSPVAAIWCIADTANQVTGAATIFTQFR